MGLQKQMLIELENAASFRKKARGFKVVGHQFEIYALQCESRAAKLKAEYDRLYPSPLYPEIMHKGKKVKASKPKRKYTRRKK